nr:uncharacterized protein LOC102147128 isoform X1 [Macaca fascicularis]XP_045234506.1 uncharacterized protein LOC102147128 isoform X1 [Macaca fascicularis]
MGLGALVPRPPLASPPAPRPQHWGTTGCVCCFGRGGGGKEMGGVHTHVSVCPRVRVCARAHVCRALLCLHMRVGLHAHMRVGVCACAHACQGLCARTGTATAEHTMYRGSVVAHIRVGVCAHMRVRLCCCLRAPAAQSARPRLGPGCACALASMGGGTQCVTHLRGSTRLTLRPCPRNCDTGARERHWGQWGACSVRVCTSDATAASPLVRAGQHPSGKASPRRKTNH